MGSQGLEYSTSAESKRILGLLYKSFANDSVSLPSLDQKDRDSVSFASASDFPYFPIPFKETETTAALKAIEGLVAKKLSALRDHTVIDSKVTVDLEKTTAFLCQAYLTLVGGHGKLEKESKAFLKDTDLLAAQSDPYRRMSANLYRTKDDGYYHIHGSLEASTTLRMIGLETHRPDLRSHEDIVSTIGSAVRNFTTEELERLNAENKQAGVPALKHEEFLQTPHGKANSSLLPWSLESLENETPATPLPQSDDHRPLSGIKVLELCRVIAGPVMGRILAEYGADVLKITSPNLSDVPFFQVDVNMGKHTAELDLKTPKDRAVFENLLAEADVVLDGYRPGAIAKLGYGAEALQRIAKERGKGIVYVNENCFGYEGEWAGRPGWQQIADCVSGVAWEQGKFMGINEPVVPPFPISDYGTGCMGAIAALTGLYHRTTRGGSWHGRVSLLQYDLLLFQAGLLPASVQDRLRAEVVEEFLALNHSHSVEQISGAAQKGMKLRHPELFTRKDLFQRWFAEKYNAEVVAVQPVVSIEGANIGFKRASRPNGSDKASWDFGGDGDYPKDQ